MIQIYTGNGKGKTTAAFGLAMRAAGRGKKVAVVQFLKNGDSGEVTSAKKLGIDVYYADVKRPPWDKDASDEWKADSIQRFELAKRLSSECDILICDELFLAISKQFISESDVLQFADSCNKIELVLTGRCAPYALEKRADLVTEVRSVKHYYHAGVPAREGIEY